MSARDVGRPDLVVDEAPIRDWRPAQAEDHHYSGGHLTALAADELFFSARGTYFGTSIGWPGIGKDFWLVYRRLEMDYLAEAFIGEELRTGVRTIGRSRRSLTVQQVLQVSDGGKTIAVGRLIVVAFDVRRRAPVELPDGLWRAIEAYEGPIGCG
jgi:acyl-CoA thioesterase FadM